MSASGPAATADSLTALYRDVIRRHAAEPVGFRERIDATHRHEAYNPLCGDRVEILLRVADEHVEAAAFDGEACAICTASASLLCSLAPHGPVGRVRQLASELAKALENRSRLKPLLQGDEAVLPRELHPLLGVRPYPSRIRCATLPWEAATAALGEG